MTDRDSERLLALYLNDHLAGSYGGAALARRIAREHPDTPELWRLAREIAEDRDELVDLMRSLGVRPRRYRMLLGVAVEKTGRLKLNGRLARRSPLSDHLEVEAMRVGVQGKLALWRALRAATEPDGPLGSKVRLLENRAERQADVLDARQAETAQVLRPGLAEPSRPTPFVTGERDRVGREPGSGYTPTRPDRSGARSGPRRSPPAS